MSDLYRPMAVLTRKPVAREALPAGQWVEEIIAAQSEAVIQILPGLQRHLDLPKIWKVAKSVAARSLKRLAWMSQPCLKCACLRWTSYWIQNLI